MRTSRCGHCRRRCYCRRRKRTSWPGEHAAGRLSPPGMDPAGGAVPGVLRRIGRQHPAHDRAADHRAAPRRRNLRTATDLGCVLADLRRVPPDGRVLSRPDRAPATPARRTSLRARRRRSGSADREWSKKQQATGVLGGRVCNRAALGRRDLCRRTSIFRCGTAVTGRRGSRVEGLWLAGASRDRSLADQRCEYVESDGSAGGRAGSQRARRR